MSEKPDGKEIMGLTQMRRNWSKQVLSPIQDIPPSKVDLFNFFLFLSVSLFPSFFFLPFLLSFSLSSPFSPSCSSSSFSFFSFYILFRLLLCLRFFVLRYFSSAQFSFFFPFIFLLPFFLPFPFSVFFFLFCLFFLFFSRSSSTFLILSPANFNQ